MKLLEIIVKNCGIAAADAVSFGLGSATKNSVEEFNNYVVQCNDALYHMQIKTFLETVDLEEDEVNKFFHKNQDNNRLGVELFKILESFYLEKQAALLAINFQNYVKGKIDKSKFNKYVNLIKKIDAHIFELIDFDLSYPQRLRTQGFPCEGLPQIGDQYGYGVFETIGICDDKDLQVIGLVEEEVEDSTNTYDGLIKPTMKRRRTVFYRDFYFDLYSKLKKDANSP